MNFVLNLIKISTVCSFFENKQKLVSKTIILKMYNIFQILPIKKTKFRILIENTQFKVSVYKQMCRHVTMEFTSSILFNLLIPSTNAS